MPTTIRPSVVSLVICDQVIDDRLSNKKSAIGLFNTILVTSLPTRIQQIAVMITLTEISHRTNLELRLMRDDDNETLWNASGAVEAPSPLAMVDLIFTLQGLPLERDGQYAFELICADESLARRRFHVHKSQKKPPQQPRKPFV